MLKQFKAEVQKILQNAQENPKIKQLHNDQVQILFESIMDAQTIEDIAIQVNLRQVNEFFDQYRYSEALVLIEVLLENRDLLSDQELLEVLDKKGVALIYTGKYEQAERIFKYLIESDIRTYKCKGLANLGITYHHLTKYTNKKLLNDAFQLFLEAQKIVDLDNRKDQFKILYNLAIIFYEKGRFEEAFKNLEDSLNFADTSKHKAMVYNEMARIYIIESRLDLAKDYLDMSERILIKRPNYHELALAWNLHIRGLWLKKKGEYTNAINCFELAMNTFVERELFSEAAEVSYELYVLNKFLETEDADEFLADYQYYSRFFN